MAEKEKETTVAEKKALHAELLDQMLTLMTSGFGLVAALAWNDAIQSFVKEFIEPRIPGSGLSFKFLYALLITVLIVFVTYQLSYLSAKLQARKKD